MKKRGKTFLLVIGIFAGLFLILTGSLLYVTMLRYADIDRKTSPDGRCQLILQMQGKPAWPFGSTYGRIIVKYDDETIKKIKIEIQDDGAPLCKENWEAAFGPAGAQITLKGSEQKDEILQIIYDGSETFSGYSEAQIKEEIKRRYGSMKSCHREGELYCFDTGKFSFLVQNNLVMSDSYKIEYFRYLTDEYFEGLNRAHEYEESGEGTEKLYTAIIALHASSSEEKERFCSDVTNWLLYVMKELPYEENRKLYRTIKIEYEDKTFDYRFFSLDDFTKESSSDVYNDLYDAIETIMADSYAEKITGKENDAVRQEDSGEENIELTEETIQYYLSLQPDCSFQTAQGTEYRMIPVDRACGSSFYSLIAVSDDEKRVALVNRDPYLGNGGTACWINFLQDGEIGFSCLSYSGGTYGSLYRTEDGGKTFERVEYPSARVKFPDGTFYNPFVMPEKIYEKNEKLYMEVGQGPDGDYYGEEGFCNGLYVSEDQGKTWSYVKEIAVQVQE